ncbi:ABC transporter substrate-binding protein [Chitinophaga polysaccharea]|uniref:ABC transporter substrate-binding protein n=1 Tax=Chitinophaga TaxID=79328 RepID=UPI0014553BDA|nr:MULTISPECIES: ABC transporter substrate-binding protein [Chitinophaga]NLR59163.1 ABC transporter substrate-binding protein [Chitinophaga polysaccharea]NLU92067.1 ABC transporter substrate-binding protein [Chitinophaga sp. Ak27]
MKIGALLPKSTFYPLLHHNLLKGVQAYLHYRQINAEIVTANIGYGVDADLMLQQAETMLLENGADVLLLYADQAAVEKIAQLARSLNKLVLLMHSGAKYMHAWEPHPAVLSNTLNHTIHCRLTGLYAAGNAADAAVCTSFYDAGYAHTHALVQPYSDSGGSVQYNFVSQYILKDFNIAPLTDFLHANPQVQTLLALFNGDLAHYFLQQLQQLTLAPQLQIFASPMLLDETLTSVHGELTVPFPIRGYVPWVSSLPHKANQLLKVQFEQYSGRAVSLDSMHGWETGIILEHIFNTAAGHQFQAKKILAALADITIDSPRGPLRMDIATHHMIAPSWLVETSENLEPVIIGENVDTLQVWQDVVREQPAGIASGWINTYLCA